jgi:hypothetical protein
VLFKSELHFVRFYQTKISHYEQFIFHELSHLLSAHAATAPGRFVGTLSPSPTLSATIQIQSIARFEDPTVYASSEEKPYGGATMKFSTFAAPGADQAACLASPISVHERTLP